MFLRYKKVVEPKLLWQQSGNLNLLSVDIAIQDCHPIINHLNQQSGPTGVRKAIV